MKLFLLFKHINLKSVHFNTRNNDQLLLQQLPVGTNSYGCPAFCYMAPTVWNKLPDNIRNAPSILSFRKQLKTYYFDIHSRPPDGCAMSSPKVS